MSCPKGGLHLLCIGSIVRARQKIVADSCIVVYIGELHNFWKSFNLDEKVNSFGLFIVIDELWDYLVDKANQLVSTFSIFDLQFILFADLSRERPQILVSPAYKIGS